MDRSQEAIEILKADGVDLGVNYTIESSEWYELIIKKNDRLDTRYFFYCEGAELIYDGWSRDTIVPIDVNPN